MNLLVTIFFTALIFFAGVVFGYALAELRRELKDK